MSLESFGIFLILKISLGFPGFLEDVFQSCFVFKVKKRSDISNFCLFQWISFELLYLSICWLPNRTAPICTEQLNIGLKIHLFQAAPWSLRQLFFARRCKNILQPRKPRLVMHLILVLLRNACFSYSYRDVIQSCKKWHKVAHSFVDCWWTSITIQQDLNKKFCGY